MRVCAIFIIYLKRCDMLFFRNELTTFFEYFNYFSFSLLLQVIFLLFSLYHLSIVIVRFHCFVIHLHFYIISLFMSFWICNEQKHEKKQQQIMHMNNIQNCIHRHCDRKKNTSRHTPKRTILKRGNKQTIYWAAKKIHGIFYVFLFSVLLVYIVHAHKHTYGRMYIEGTNKYISSYTSQFFHTVKAISLCSAIKFRKIWSMMAWNTIIWKHIHQRQPIHALLLLYTQKPTWNKLRYIMYMYI